MNELINDWVTTINGIGETFWQYSSQVFVQSSILIALLLIIDFLLRRRVRATLRYWMWMLVFIKLILPPTLSLPTGIGYWLGGRLSPVPVASEESPAAPTPENKQIGIDRMAAKGAEITSVEMGLFEILRTAEHPKFRQIAKLIK